VATVGRNDYMEVEVNAPEEVLGQVSAGLQVEGRAGGRPVTARVKAVVPSGDVATRTFPVKLRIDDPAGLVQGMGAHMRLPSGKPVQGIIVPRDAVLPHRGQNVVWVNRNGTAGMVPVELLAYKGLNAAVKPAGRAPLKPGMQVVVKGNERLRPGQPVQPVKGQGPMNKAPAGQAGDKPSGGQAEGNATAGQKPADQGQ
jgi:RND family efflux transporter MFP subunit